MQLIVTWVLALALLTIAATFGLKLLRTAAGRRQTANQKRLEPLLEGFEASGEKCQELQSLSPRKRNRFLAPLLIQRMTYVHGAARQRMIDLARELGLVEKSHSELRSRSRWRRARAAERLGHFGDVTHVGDIGALLTDEDETVRAVAARALAKLATPEAVDLLVRTLNNSSELTRLRIAENLDRLGAQAVPYLIARLDETERCDADASERGLLPAIRVLGGMRTYEARSALRDVVSRDINSGIRAHAVWALGRCGGPADVRLLVECSRDDDGEVRMQAARALGLIGDTSAIPRLKGLTSDQTWWVREAAAQALANIGPGGENALLEVIVGDDEEARDRAISALEASGATGRFVREITCQEPLGTRAREAISVITSSGATRHLTDLLSDVGAEEHQILERALASAAASEGEHDR